MLDGDYLFIYLFILPIVLQSMRIEENFQLICLHISVFTGGLNSEILGNAGSLNACSKFLGQIELFPFVIIRKPFECEGERSVVKRSQNMTSKGQVC